MMNSSGDHPSILRTRLLLFKVICPSLHHPTPFGKQIAPPVGRFHPVLNHVGQRHLRYLSREARDLAGPVSETGAESMRHVVSPGTSDPISHTAHQLQQGHVRQRSSVAGSWKDIRVAFDPGKTFQNRPGGIVKLTHHKLRQPQDIVGKTTSGYSMGWLGPSATS